MAKTNATQKAGNFFALMGIVALPILLGLAAYQTARRGK